MSMSLIGEMAAAGRTPRALSDAITSKSAEDLAELKAVLLMRSFARQLAFVAGEVSHPGVVNRAQGSLTVAQSIASAGGVTDGATLRDVLPARRVPGQAQKIILGLDIAEAVGGKHPAPDLARLADERLDVARSGAGDVTTRIRRSLLNTIAVGSCGLSISAAA